MLEKLFEEKVDINLWFMLKCIYDKVPNLPNHKKIKGWLNLLERKNLIKNNTLTLEGEYVLSLFSFDKNKRNENKKNKITYDYSKLLDRLKNKLEELIGKKQYYLIFKGIKYPYLPSAKDLELKIEKFKYLYRVDNMDIIEKCLLKHLEHRNQKLIYYILKEKEGRSDLSSDYENFNENDTSFHNSFLDIA
jgi:hypothetical protein